MCSKPSFAACFRFGKRSPGWVRFLLTLSLLSGLGGCAAVTVPASAPGLDTLPDPHGLYEKMLAQAGAVKTLNGTARIRIQNESGVRRLDALVACDRRGWLRFEVVDFFDHVLFLAIIREGRLIAYSVGDNRALREPATPQTLEQILGVPAGGEALIALALGSPFFVPLNAPSLHIERDERGAVLEANDPSLGLRYRIRLDAEARAVQAELISAGRAFEAGVLRVDFDGYRRVNERAFPFHIRVQDGAGRRSFSIRYQGIVLNESLDAALFEFEPPEDAEEMTW